MENRPITKKQEEILNYIKDEILERGFPPAVREICQAVGLKLNVFWSTLIWSHWRKMDTSAATRRSRVRLRF